MKDLISALPAVLVLGLVVYLVIRHQRKITGKRSRTNERTRSNPTGDDSQF